MSVRKPGRRAAAVLTVAAGFLLGIGTAPAGAESVAFQVSVSDGGLEIDWGELPGNHNLAPGDVIEAPALLRNDRDTSVRLDLRSEVIADNDQGCTEPEARVDNTCGAGEGELSSHLNMTLNPAQRPRDAIHLDAADGAAAPAVWLDAGQAREYTFRITIPREVGNVVQTDQAEFRLVAAAEGIGTANTEPVTVAASGGTSAGGTLPFTGANVLPLLTFALALLGAGAALVTATRRRRSAGVRARS